MSKKDVFVEAVLGVFSGSREALHAPNSAVEPGEEVVGILESQKARAMFSLMVELNKANVHISNKLKDACEREGGLSREVVNMFECDIHRAQNQSSVVSSLFWELVHEEFPKSRVATVAVGIREGWKVVVYKNNNPSLFDQMSVLSLRRKLFGEG